MTSNAWSGLFICLVAGLLACDTKAEQSHTTVAQNIVTIDEDIKISKWNDTTTITYIISQPNRQDTLSYYYLQGKILGRVYISENLRQDTQLQTKIKPKLNIAFAGQLPIDCVECTWMDNLVLTSKKADILDELGTSKAPKARKVFETNATKFSESQDSNDLVLLNHLAEDGSYPFYRKSKLVKRYQKLLTVDSFNVWVSNMAIYTQKINTDSFECVFVSFDKVRSLGPRPEIIHRVFKWNGFIGVDLWGGRGMCYAYIINPFSRKFIKINNGAFETHFEETEIVEGDKTMKLEDVRKALR